MSRRLTFEDYLELATSRGHQIIDFSGYTSVRSKITFYCHQCYTTFTTSGHSYKNAKKTGCSGCKKKDISLFQEGRPISEETKKLIGEKASQRSGSLTGVFGANHPKYKGGFGRDLKNPSTNDYIWKNAVKKLYDRKCALTGKGEKDRLESHHLNAYHAFPDQRYDASNGVLLSREVHMQFHRIYTTRNNTEAQFTEFCKIYYKVDWPRIKRIP